MNKKWYVADIKNIIYLRDQGAKIITIAKYMDLTPNAVSKALKRYKSPRIEAKIINTKKMTNISISRNDADYVQKIIQFNAYQIKNMLPIQRFKLQ
jgi:predicted transcriptional regulator